MAQQQRRQNSTAGKRGDVSPKTINVLNKVLPPLIRLLVWILHLQRDGLAGDQACCLISNAREKGTDNGLADSSQPSGFILSWLDR